MRRPRRVSSRGNAARAPHLPMNATEACIALNMLPTVGPVRLRKLLEVFQEPQQILAARRSELRKAEGIGNEAADQISNWQSPIAPSPNLQQLPHFAPTRLP